MRTGVFPAKHVLSTDEGAQRTQSRKGKFHHEDTKGTKVFVGCAVRTVLHLLAAGCSDESGICFDNVFQSVGCGESANRIELLRDTTDAVPAGAPTSICGNNFAIDLNTNLQLILSMILIASITVVKISPLVLFLPSFETKE